MFARVETSVNSLHTHDKNPVGTFATISNMERSYAIAGENVFQLIQHIKRDWLNLKVFSPPKCVFIYHVSNELHTLCVTAHSWLLSLSQGDGTMREAFFGWMGELRADLQPANSFHWSWLRLTNSSSFSVAVRHTGDALGMVDMMNTSFFPVYFSTFTCAWPFSATSPVSRGLFSPQLDTVKRRSQWQKPNRSVVSTVTSFKWSPVLVLFSWTATVACTCGNF